MMSAAVRSTRIVCFYSSSILLLGSLLMLQPHRSDGKSVPGFAGSGAMVGNEAAASVPSSSKLWPKATLQQALRQIRGFRPQSLSTARGFGKRFDAQYMPFNPTSGVLSTAGTSSPSSSSASSSLSSLPTSSSSFAPSASFDLSSYLLRPTYPLIDNRADSPDAFVRDDAILLRYLINSRRPAAEEPVRRIWPDEDSYALADQ